MGIYNKISCICVTRGRPLLLKNAIKYFLDQDYPNKELVVLVEKTDPSIAEISGKDVNIFIIPCQEMSLGELRNYAISCSTGEYVAQWDDDDGHHPQRLSRQYNAMKGFKGSVLKQVTIFDSISNQRYISNERLWEGTILVDKKALQKNPYPALSRGEDTPVIEALDREGSLQIIDAPELYTYVYHGDNTWDRHHFQEIIDCSSKL